jgi:hypothetical protein
MEEGGKTFGSVRLIEEAELEGGTSVKGPISSPSLRLSEPACAGK